MNKNIKQDYFSQVKKALDKVDKAGDLANHFRGVVLIGDKNRQQAYSWLHAPQTDIENLLLHAMRTSDMFTYSAAKALEARYNEIKTKNNNDNEKDTFQET